MLPGEPGKEPVGRVVTISSLTGTTIVSTTGLLFGGLSEQAYAQKWAWRPKAANTTDTVRMTTAYAPDTGTLTVATMSDTTATDEYCLISQFSPFEWRLAINRAVATTRYLDMTIIPVIAGQPKHYMHELDWIEFPTQVKSVGYDHSPVITRNRYLQKRNKVNTSGKFEPEFWTVANNASTAPFAATDYRNQKYAYSLERSGGTDATLVQAASAMQTGVAGDRPVGETITVVMVADPDTAGDAQIKITDGTSTASTSTSDGGAALGEYTTSITLNEGATTITTTVTAQTSNAAQKIYEAYALVGDLTDSVRRDDYPVYPLRPDQYQFEQGGPLVIHSPFLGSPGRFHITSERPYVEFDSTRLSTGAADTDETDAPVDVIAAGAIFYLFRGRGYAEAKEWERKFDQLRRSHLAMKTDGPGFPLMGPPLTRAAVRMR